MSYDKLDPVCNLCTFWDVGVFRVSLSDAGDAFLEKWLRDSGFISQPLEGEDDLIGKRKKTWPACVSVQSVYTCCGVPTGGQSKKRLAKLFPYPVLFV